MKIRRFEEIRAWQEARELVKMIYQAIRDNKNFYRDFGLREQIQRASISVVSNIAEGFGRRSRKEFIQFLFVAKGSIAEVQSQLYIALDQSYITQEVFSMLYDKSEEVAKLLSGFITYLLKSSTSTQRTQRTQQTQRTQ